MNLNQFLKKEGLSKTDLAKKLGWLPQNLNQALGHHSSKFLTKLNTHFPDYLVRYINDYYIFEKIDIVFDGTTTVHQIQKKELLEVLRQYPSVYSFIAATDSNEFDVYFDTPENRKIVFGRSGSSEIFGIFPAKRLENLANYMLVSEIEVIDE